MFLFSIHCAHAGYAIHWGMYFATEKVAFVWFFIAALIILGLISLLTPRFYWYLCNWWRREGKVEPNNLALYAYRI